MNDLLGKEHSESTENGLGDLTARWKTLANSKAGRIALYACLLMILLALPIRMSAQGNSHLPGLRHVEEIAQRYYTEQLPKVAAATVFTHVVSGALALVEEARFSVVVFSVAPGKLLSGLHDSIRQLGNALLLCTGMFATGTIIMGMLTFTCFKLLIPAALALRILCTWRPELFRWAGNISGVLATGAILLWLFFPTTALVNSYVQSAYLDERIAAQLKAMEADKANLQAIQEGILHEEAAPKKEAAKSPAPQEASAASRHDEPGIFSRGMDAISRVGAALSPGELRAGMQARITAATDAAGNIVQSLVQVVVMFMLVTVVIPLGVLALFIAIGKAALAPRP